MCAGVQGHSLLRRTRDMWLWRPRHVMTSLECSHLQLQLAGEHGTGGRPKQCDSMHHVRGAVTLVGVVRGRSSVGQSTRTAAAD